MQLTGQHACMQVDTTELDVAKRVLPLTPTPPPRPGVCDVFNDKNTMTVAVVGNGPLSKEQLQSLEVR